MKNTIKIFVLSVLVLTVTNVYSQSKKELLDQNEQLRLQIGEYERVVDSLETEGKNVSNFLSHIQLNILKSESDTSIESIQTSLDSFIYESKAEDKVDVDSLSILSDSITTINKISEDLVMEIEILKEIIHGGMKQSDYPQSANDFKGIWHLSNTPVALQNGEEGKGLISYSRMDIPDTFLVDMVKQIEFFEDDLADIHFRDGSSEKCFFSISNFSKSEPFTISFNRRDADRLVLLVVALPEGLQFSYRGPDIDENEIFFRGYMTK